MILWHVQLLNRGARRCGRHPTALPRHLGLDRLLHLTRLREGHRAREELREPRRLQAVREHIVECGDLRAKEGDARHVNREHRAVEVQAVTLELKLLLNVRIEVVVILDEAGAVHDEVGRDGRAVVRFRELDAIGLVAIDRVLTHLQRARTDHIARLIGKDLAAGEDINLYAGGRHHLAREAELKGEDQLDEAPHEPLERREEAVQPPRERRDVVVRRQQRMAESAISRPLEGDQVEDLTRDRPVSLPLKQRHLPRAALDRGDRAVDGRLAAAHDDDTLARRLLAARKVERVEHLALEGLLARVIGDVRAGAAVHTRRHDDKVEGLRGGSRTSVAGCDRHEPAALEGRRVKNGRVELDEPVEVEMGRKGLDVLLHVRTLGELVPLLVGRVREGRELVELLRHLEAEVCIVRRPHAADLVG